MVEGPGCTLKGEKLGPRAKGQVVKGVLGNAVDRVSNRGEDCGETGGHVEVLAAQGRGRPEKFRGYARSCFRGKQLIRYIVSFPATGHRSGLGLDGPAPVT